MHAAAYQWVEERFAGHRGNLTDLVVVEFGSLDINGSVRPIFAPYVANGLYIGVDPQEGPGVDVVGSAHEYGEADTVDVVVCAEVFEHTPLWPAIVRNAHRILRKDGLFVATMAGEGRMMHSAIDEQPIRAWEHYANIFASDLYMAMTREGFTEVVVDRAGTDLRCAGVK